MSSITPLLLLNFHFHFTIALRKKNIDALFLNQTTYISNFFMFLFLILYFKGLTCTLDF